MQGVGGRHTLLWELPTQGLGLGQVWLLIRPGLDPSGFPVGLCKGAAAAWPLLSSAPAVVALSQKDDCQALQAGWVEALQGAG